MKMRMTILAAALAASAATAGDLESDFRNPPRDARARCWWWWLNSNVDKDVISRDLAEMKKQGMGGAAIFDAGGATQDGHRPVPGGPVFASPEWKALFRHALDEAARNDLELSLNIQSGWNLGGPMVKIEDSTKRIVWTETRVAGGAVDVVLPKPDAKLGVYGEIAVVAVPVRGAGPGGATLRADSQQSDHMAAHSADGNADTFWVSAGGQPGQGPKPSAPAWLEVEFSEPVPVDRVQFAGRKGYGPKAGRIEIPDGRGGARVAGTFENAKADGAVGVAFAACTTRVVRLVVTDAHDSRYSDTPRNVQVAEWSVSGGGRKHPMRVAAESRITDFEQKAYHVYPGKFNATKAQHLVRPESADPAEAACAAAEVVDLSASMDAAGRLRWTAPAGAWRVLRFGYTAAGSHVSTCSPGWEGHAVDHMDPAMVDRYWKDVMEGLIEAAGPHVGKAWLGVQTDSWELGPINWTPAFPAEFKARRGYDLAPWMPALTGVIVGSRELSNRFLADYRRTLADLFAAHCRRFADLAHARGFKLQAEMGGPHAAPIDALQTMGMCDFPTGEFWTRNNRHRIEDNFRFFIKQGASAAHIYGHRRMQAESFTSIGPQWERAPGDLKHDLDRAYCEGLNHMMLHTFTCSPASAGLPGQEYFAGTHFNPNVTWWPRSAAFFAYASRCQAVLQAGLFAADVLHYYGDNIPSFVRLKADDPAAVLPGYDYDVCNTEVLLERVAAKDGRIVLPDGMSYAMISLPDDGVLSLPVLKKIAALADAGVPVAGPRPLCRTGLTGGAEADREFAALCERLWSGGLVAAKPVREVLAARGIAPDFAFASPQTNAFYDYIHRRADGAEIYFVVNRWARRAIQDTQYRLRTDLPDRHEEFEASFRVTGLAPELWDPMTGAIEACAVWREEKGRTIVPLRLGPEGSVFVIFRRAPAGPHITAVAKGGRVLIPSANSAPGTWPVVRASGAGGKLWLEAWESGDYEVRWSDGRTTKVAVPALPPPAAAAGPWTVRFTDGRGAPASVPMAALADWSKSAEPGIRNYSGAARYAGSLVVPPAAGVRWTLDMGDLYEIGGASLNGRDLGTAWHAPFRLDATEAVKAGANALEVEVINVWANRMIGDAKLPPEKRVAKSNITKYERMDVPLRTSGLLGPVELRASRRVEIVR